MEENLFKRRDFISNVVKAGTAGILTGPVLNHFTTKESLTVSQIMERIIAEVPGGKIADTVDTLKSGSGNQVVTGIITTMFATVELIRRAATMNVNFIIAHEPTFYNHRDNKKWVENNQVTDEKAALLEKHQIAVWRFHDYCHALKPDGILHGVLIKADWLKYNPSEEVNFKIPPMALKEIIAHLKKSLHIPHLRYIGDPESICHSICLLPGAWGGEEQLSTLIKSKADLLVVGESSEWETPEYIRDARAFGKQVSLIVLGHSFSEEPGMEWMAQWLQPKFPSIPVTSVASGEPFSWS